VHKNRAGAAISSGLPTRPRGTYSNSSPLSASSSAGLDISYPPSRVQPNSRRFLLRPFCRKAFYHADQRPFAGGVIAMECFTALAAGRTDQAQCVRQQRRSEAVSSFAQLHA